MNAYKDFCFEQQSMVLGQKNVSLDDFVVEWSALVANEFGLDQATLESLYSSGDSYETDWETREMWKYAASKGVSGTPVAFVNGVKLDNTPFTVEGWMEVLNYVYDQ